MAGTPFQSGIESLVAEALRVHVLDAVLDRPEVRRNLSPEAVERLREDLRRRLSRSEEEGRAHRAEVLAVVQGALGAAGPAGTLVRSALSAAWERLAPAPPPPPADAAPPEDSP